MRKFRLTIKNYRAFSDESPVRIELESGIIAFVGKNNSGKSSLLAMFHELRNLWAILTGQNIIHIFQDGWLVQVNYLNVLDPLEIFCNTNQRDISIDLELLDRIVRPGDQTNILSRITFICRRNAPLLWQFDAYSDGNPASPIKIGAQVAGWARPSIAAIPGHGPIDTSYFTEIFQILHRSLYVPAFRNAINQGSGDYYDLAVGTSFISLWHSWRAGAEKQQIVATQRITDEIRKIFELDSLEIVASEQLRTLNIIVNGTPYRLSELGSGMAQFIIVLANCAIKGPWVLLIDEPELNLHPALQIDFVTTVASYAKATVVFATHSIGLARSVADHIYSFWKDKNKTIVKTFNATPNYAEFLGELSFSSFNEMGHNRILLVEGVHDVKTFQEFLRKIRKDHETVILPLGGDQLARGGVELELSEITRLSNNVHAIVDSERTSKSSPASAARGDFAATCKKLGINVLLTERRAIENYLSDVAVKVELGNNFRALSAYEPLKDCSPNWGKTLNWRIARRMSFDEIKHTDIGAFLSRL